MRRFSPPSHFRYLPATSAASEACIMSSRSPHSGGRTQVTRTFSTSESTSEGVRIVNSGSRFVSGRGANSGWQQRSGSFYDSSQPRRFSFGHRVMPHNRQSSQQFHQASASEEKDPYFGRASPSYQNQGVRQPFNQNYERRQPRARPPDYRSWEYAKIAPPPNSVKFIVLSYNILADYLAIEHRSKLYFHIPEYMMDWQWRKKNIMFELGLWAADIMCLQEVDRFQDLEEELKHKGYAGIWKMRTGNSVDGCAIFWRMSRFKLLYEECIEFSNLQLRDNVAQICVLELLRQNDTQNATASQDFFLNAPDHLSAVSCKVVICNIHVLYNPKRGEIKLGQVRTLLDKAHAISKRWNDAPIVLCGDFNCTPKSPLYNFLSQQKLDLSLVDRDKVSGQASAEIHSPFFLTRSGQTVDAAGQVSSPIESKEIVAQGFHTVPCSISLQSETEEIIHNKEITEETQQTGDDTIRNDTESAASDTSKELSSQFINERTEFELDMKIANLSLEELGEIPASERASEDDKAISSPLCDSKKVLLPDSGEMLSSDEGADDPSPRRDTNEGTPTYDPSLWTPAEIAIASGSEDCTYVEHPLQLRSTYTEVEDCSGTRDSDGEPIVTSYNRRFLGTVDYIWHSEGLQTVRVLASIPKHVMQQKRGFPTKKWGSDHIALASELAFTKT